MRRIGGRSAALAVAIGLVLASATTIANPGEAASAASGTSAADPPDAVPVALFGDSLFHSAEPKIRAALADRSVVAFDAANGTITSEHLEAMTATLGAPAPPAVVIIELGTNDVVRTDPATFEIDLRAALDRVSPSVGCIRWFDVTTTTADPAFNREAARFNAVLARVVGDYPNAESMHYRAWAALAGPSQFLGDGLHPNRFGRRELALLVAQAVNGCDPTRSTGPFWDVPDASPEAESVRWLGETGIEIGKANGTFRGTIASLRPVINRRDWMMWLWRMAGAPPAAPAGWTDVSGPALDAVDWAAATGIKTPPASGRFRPTAPLTREALAVFAWRFAGSPAGSMPDPWADVRSGSLEAVRWTTQQHLLEPVSDQHFAPDAFVTRTDAAMAAFRLHLLGLPS